MPFTCGSARPPVAVTVARASWMRSAARRSERLPAAARSTSFSSSGSLNVVHHWATGLDVSWARLGWVAGSVDVTGRVAAKRAFTSSAGRR